MDDTAQLNSREYTEFCDSYGICLNSQQERAVQAVDGATLLLAVPGSGKTTVLVARLGYMILAKGINPKSILSMTYTNAAANDMRKRFSSVFGSELGEKMTFSTINSVANKILGIYARKTGNFDLTLLPDGGRRKAIIRGILQSVRGEYPTDSDISDAETVITYIKNMMLTNKEIDGLKCSVPDAPQVYKAYKEILKREGCYDFDDQLVFAFVILKKDREILELVRRRFRYICVDEAQDTSRIQHEIIKLIASGSNNIFMVGDEDQSIYGFRAAYPEALINFKKDYKSPSILYMETNYRSTPEIIEKAAGFIKKNTARYNKNIVPSRQKGLPVGRIGVDSRAGQYRHLLKIAAEAPADTAVLYRDNDCAVPLVDLFLREGIPFRANALKDSFFTSKVVMDILAFMRLSLDPYDCEAFMQIYYKCGLGIRKEMAHRICQKSEAENIKIADSLVWTIGKSEKYMEKALTFRRFITNLSKQRPFAAIEMIKSNGYNSYMIKSNLDFGKIEILSMIAEKEMSVSSFMARLKSLEKLFSQDGPLGTDGIILTTIHSAKGLEYDTVYLIDVYDGILPLTDDSEDEKEYQEERRLFYVAMTRAKNSLNIFDIRNKESAFIREIFPKR